MLAVLEYQCRYVVLVQEARVSCAMCIRYLPSVGLRWQEIEHELCVYFSLDFNFSLFLTETK